MDIVFHVPINRVSFGQVSINLLKEAKRQGHRAFIFPIGPVDLATSNVTDEFKAWITESVTNCSFRLDKGMKCIKLWHLVIPDENITARGQYDKICDDTTFLSFYELDSPTPLEINVTKNFDTAFSSTYTVEAFNTFGAKTRFVPLGFDSDNFSTINKKFFEDDRISFCLLGKYEHRKHHQRIIKAWVKKFGNDRSYYLQCAVYNPFFNPQMNSNLILGSMEGKRYFNVNSVPWIPTNKSYNEFLNSNHIVIGMSGGEGWGLPEFHTVAIGKHAVILNAHAYKDWADKQNAVLVNPLNKIPSHDGLFFKRDGLFNQGNIFSWDEDEFIAGCEEAIARYNKNPVNVAGLELQKKFTYEKTLNALLQK